MNLSQEFSLSFSQLPVGIKTSRKWENGGKACRNIGTTSKETKKFLILEMICCAIARFQCRHCKPCFRLERIHNILEWCFIIRERICSFLYLVSPKIRFSWWQNISRVIEGKTYIFYYFLYISVNFKLAN